MSSTDFAWLNEHGAEMVEKYGGKGGLGSERL